MTEQPLVSIGLPTYNRALTLRHAIESALTQDYQNIELIISDNASTDETPHLCAEVCAQDRRVKYIRQPSNRGVIANFREALDQSTGEFFMWLADDDRLDRSYVGRCVQVLMERKDYVLVCGISRFFYDGRLMFEGEILDLLQPSGDERVLSYYMQVTYNGVFYGMMRRTQVLEVPLHNTMGGDWLYGASVAFIGKIETLKDICLTRSLGGASASYEALAANLGLSSFAGAYPHISIAASAFTDIAWRSPVYSRKTLLSRLLLACKVFAIVVRKDASLARWNLKYLAVRVAAKILPAQTLEKIRTRRRERAAIRD